MRNARRAFTLIELLVAVALLVLLAGVVVFVFTKSVQVFIVADARAQIFQNVRAGIDMMRQELMTAEPLLQADGTSTNLQRLRIENRTYVNTKWGQNYPNDVLQVWKLKAPLNPYANGTQNTSTAYAKYYLDVGTPDVQGGTGNKEVPTLKRKSCEINPAVSSAWYQAATTDAGNEITSTSDTTPKRYLVEELMQYVVGFDVEPYYPNAGKSTAGTDWFGDAHWNLDAACGGANDFKDAEGAQAGDLYLVKCDSTGTSDLAVATPWTSGSPAVFNVSSIPDGSGSYVKRAVFATVAPAGPAQPWSATNQRAVSPLPTGLRLTFYIRDERSKEQRAIPQTIWMPMWGG